MSSGNYYITSPIYYVNGTPHIGHAYTSVVCDVIARFKRLDNYMVKFLTGTDEHGQKVERAAAVAGMSPEIFVDTLVPLFRTLLNALNCTHSDFIRTTEERHISFVQQIWRTMIRRGFIYQGTYAGWYSTRDECFFSAEDLIDGKTPEGAPVEWVEEPSYFFKLSAFQQPLLEFYDKHPSFIAPGTRRNEAIAFIKRGLKDLSISRSSFNWGIPVPDDTNHIMYVWIDALFNYLSAVKEDISEYWPCDLHIVGKDILLFHAVYWPAFLMSVDISPPKRIFAHGWWTNNGQKISKSLGNTLDPLTLIEEFGTDYLRYFFIKEVPFGEDGSYSKGQFIGRINADLVNNIGNLIQRTLVLVYKITRIALTDMLVLTEDDRNMLDAAYSIPEKIRKNMDALALHKILNDIISIGASANAYIERQAPWNLRSNPARLQVVLYILLEVIRVIGIFMQPFIPEGAKRILDALGINEDKRTFAHVFSEDITNNWALTLQNVRQVKASPPIFKKLKPEELIP